MPGHRAMTRRLGELTHSLWCIVNSLGTGGWMAGGGDFYTGGSSDVFCV